MCLAYVPVELLEVAAEVKKRCSIYDYVGVRSQTNNFSAFDHLRPMYYRERPTILNRYRPGPIALDDDDAGLFW